MAVFRNAAIAAAALLAGCTSVIADARTFAGTDWRVTAINGTATPANGAFSMSFTATDFAAHFGCNRGGGSYRIAGDVMSAGAVFSTQMACASATDEGPDPMAFERMGFAVLNQPMRITWRSARELTLSNSAGSIALEVLP